MHEHSENISSLASWLSYTFGVSLMVGDFVAALDHHAGAIGACIAILTYTTNLAFKIYDRIRARVRAK